MRILFIIFLGFCLKPAFSQNAPNAQNNSAVVGLWSWSGTGCRDQDLSAESHVSRSKSAGLLGIKASQLRLYSDGRAEMTTAYTDAESPQRQTGFYEINGGEVVINQEDFILHIVGNRLLIVGTHQESEEICGGGQDEFVYVMGKVDDNPETRP